MRGKPISFAQVLKTKGICKDRQLNQHKTLSEIMQQFQISPQQDYTLYLSQSYHNSKNNVTSFRAIGSKVSVNEQSEMFDSWIQKQSFVGNKQNHRQLITSRNQPQRDIQDPKKVLFTSKGKQNKEPLKSVADLVRKIQSNEVNNNNGPFFKANSKGGQISDRPKQQRKQQTKDDMKTIRKLHQRRQNQQSSFRSQYEINTSPQLVPDRLNAKAYIQQVSVLKNQPKQQVKQELKDLIAKTQFIHLDIAQLAHQYLNEAQPQNQQKDQDSLLIQNSDKKTIKDVKQEVMEDKSVSTIPWKEQSRWKDAMSKMNLYLKKISQQDIQEPKKMEQKPQINNHTFSQINHTTNNQNEVGYSFAVNEVEKIKPQTNIPTLQFGNIPKIQQIKSQRMSYQYKKQTLLLNDSPLIPEGGSIPSIESVKLQFNRNPIYQDQNLSSSSAEFSAKRINSSLAFSQNNKDTPSPQMKQQRRSNKISQGQSQQKQVTLSFTQQKPQIIINIPLNYAEEQTEQFQMQAVQIKKQLINDYQNISSLSPQKQNLFLPTRNDLYENHQQPTYQNHNHFIIQTITNKIDQNIGQYYLQDSIDKKQEEKIEEEKIMQFSGQEFPKEKQWIKYQINHESKRLDQQIQINYNIPLANITKLQKQEEKPKPINQISSNTLIRSINVDNNTKELKNSPKDSGTKGSPSNSMFGLKKVYSSPKTNIIPCQPPAIATSAFIDCHEAKPKQSNKVEFVSQPKGYLNEIKSFQRSNKIEPVAYTFNPKKLKQSPKPAIQEEGDEFQFDF